MALDQLRLLGEICILASIVLETLVPLAPQTPTAGTKPLGKMGFDLFGYQEGFLGRPAVSLLGQPHFVDPQRCPVRAVRVGLVG